MTFVHSLWRWPNWGWTRENRRFREHRKDTRLYRRYFISTGGWSGNESLISAMEQNFIFQALCWYSARVGGHYEYRLPA